MGETRGAPVRRVLLLVGAPVLVILLLVAAVLPQLADAPDPTRSIQASINQRADLVLAVAASELALTAAIESYLSRQPGEYSVSVRELDGDQRTAVVDGEREVEPASTIKLFYAYAALLDVEAGLISLDAEIAPGVTVATCLRVMIEISDNLCAEDLRAAVGFQRINELLASQGYTGTYVVLDAEGNFVTKRTTTDDLVTLLTRLDEGSLLGAESTELLMTHLRAQMWRNKISSGVQVGTVVASKSGTLMTDTGMMQGDAAIVYGERSSYVLAVLGTDDAVPEAIRGVSAIVYRHLQGSLRSPARYPESQFITTVETALRDDSRWTHHRLRPCRHFRHHRLGAT